MGRNLYRRTSLIPVLYTGIILNAGALEAPQGILPARQDFIPPASHPDELQALPSRQNHAPEKAWSIQITPRLLSHPEFKRQLTRWKSLEGRRRLEAAFRGAAPFRGVVDHLIRRSGLPWELTAIPVVESNWRFNAVSSSGAAGPWQFLPATARGRGLVMDAWRDDRRDPWEATRAALEELAFYKRLQQDWLLAVASYNAGPTRIRQLREESGAQTFWDMMDRGILPEETRGYIPQILAVSYITAHAGRLGLPLNWTPSHRWEEIELAKAVHLGVLAETADVPLHVLTLANRALQSPLTPPPGCPYTLKVPKESADVVRHEISRMDDAGLPGRFWRYTVQSGDTLWDIAERSGISLSELIRYNDHVRNGLLRIGERLYLPGSEPPPGADDDEIPDWQGRHTVANGESLWSIARRYNVAPERLAEANYRSMDAVLPAGGVLRVPDTEDEL